MTRLTEGDVYRLPELLPEIDQAFRYSTGAGLAELARLAALGQTRRAGAAALPGTGLIDLSGLKVGVVPISAGRGFIPGFPEAVAAICRFMDCEAFVTDRFDVAGLAAAAERQARLVLLADDERFICLDIRSGGLADNGEATGRGYAAALAAAASHLAAPGSPEKPGRAVGDAVLVIGMGPVGRAAARWLAEAGFDVVVHDLDAARLQEAEKELQIRMVSSLEEGLASAHLILDASPAVDLIDVGHVSERTIIAAPGMPVGVTTAAAERLGKRFLHEPLALGVVTMVYLAFSRGRVNDG